jgi:hypothetical protein
LVHTSEHQFSFSQFLDELENYAISTYYEHLHSVEVLDQQIYAKVFQPIVNAPIGQYGFGYEYPIHPSKGIAEVRAHAITEPLKVRMITKGLPENWILKPLQKAMFNAMKDFSCFRLTSGEHIDLNQLDLTKRFLLSGDYESATDRLNMDVMQTVVDELLKVLPKEIHRYIIKESSSHLISYPDSSGLSPVLQTRGQLMGSLLSFPILCIANACTYGLATKTDSLHDVKALINGDDILFCNEYRVIRSWKRIATAMGLKPSIGKNFQSENWGTVNSQLVIRNKDKWFVEKTGLYNCLFRKFDSPLTITKALENFPKSLVVSVSKRQLQQTPQSVDISTRFGGLGLENTRKPNQQDMEIYLFKSLSKQTKVELKIDDLALVTGPKDIIQKYVDIDIVNDAIKCGQYPPKSISFGESTQFYDPDPITDQDYVAFDWLSFKKFKKFYRTVPALREIVAKRQFGAPINHHKLVTSWVKIENLKDLPLHAML